MSPPGVEIRNEHPRIRPSLARLQRTAGRLLKRLGHPGKQLSVLLTDDRRMRRLNRRFLRRNRPTDVLAFPGDSPLLGDIVISLDTARRQAASHGNSFRYELAFYLAHGILHLTGWRDKTKEDRAKMLRKQEDLLTAIGVD